MMKSQTETVTEFLKMVEDRSKFRGRVSYDYVAGFLYSTLKDLVRIPGVQEALEVHVDALKFAKENLSEE